MTTVNYDRAVAYYDETRRYRYGVPDRYRLALRPYLQVDAPAPILELAVGTGLLGAAFIAAGDDYVGVDISRGMMLRIPPKLSKGAAPRLAQADIARALPFPNDSFALIHAVRVFHLLDDWRRCIRESRRALRPGGRLLIVRNAAPDSIASDPPWAKVHQQWDRILRALGVGEAGIRHGIQRTDEMMMSYLRSLGADTKLVDLLSYRELEVSCRMMVDRRARKMFSSDWALPADIHARALKRLRAWLENECPAPDELVAQTMVFRAVVARWAD